MKPTIQYISEELRNKYPEGEIRAFTRLILEKVCGLSYTRQLLLRDEALEETQKEEIAAVVERLKSFEPIQYVLGEAHFLDMALKVNPSVLIPRPETEELVQWIADRVAIPNPVFLDIGTGSGCIALGIGKLVPDAVVYAADISEKALETARINAAANRLDVQFIQADILQWESYAWQKYDVVVSNPPYVCESEKAAMAANVLQYEPASALFVPDADPLRFYRSITGFAHRYLKSNGWLFFEINESLAREMETLVSSFGFSRVEIRNDLSGKSRMLCCRKSS